MSRFLEVLNKHHDAIGTSEILDICREMKRRLEAEEAHLELRSPTSSTRSPGDRRGRMIDIQVTFSARLITAMDFVHGVRAPATSLCPCSRRFPAGGPQPAL